MQELACVDLSMEIAERSLEVVRGSIEAAAARERDEAAARLLSELELEDASKKVKHHPWLCVFRGRFLEPLSEHSGWAGRGLSSQSSSRVLKCKYTLCTFWTEFVCTQAAEEKKGKAKKAKKKAAKAAKGICSA